MSDNNRNFIVTYEIDYTHHLDVGVIAINQEEAKKIIKRKLEEGTIFDNTETMPLLYDDYEEHNLNTLRFSVKEVIEFPEPDISVEVIKRREFAFQASRAILSDDYTSALLFAKKALPDMDAEYKLWSSNNGQISFGSKLSSTELFSLVNDHNIEVTLSLQGGGEATHFLYSDKAGYCFHEGIDGVVERTSLQDFLANYPDSLGKVWSISQKVQSKTTESNHTFVVKSENGCDPFKVITSCREDAFRDALYVLGWRIEEFKSL